MKRLLAVMITLFLFLSLLDAKATVYASMFSSADNSVDINIEGIDWKDYEGVISARFDILDSGYYNILFNYIPKTGRYDNIELYIQIDGKPLSSSYLSLNRVYEYGELREDENHNQLRALTSITDNPQTEMLRKKDNSDSRYISVYLEEGSHDIRIEGRRTDFILLSIDFIEESKISLNCENPETNNNSALIHIEAENIYSSSSTSLTSQIARDSAEVMPSNPKNLVFNIAGGDNWNDDGETLSWRFNVEESGFYTLHFKYRQPFKKGFAAYRRVLVDGKVPGENLDEIAFPFSNDWCFLSLEDSVYIEQGEHTISLEVVPGAYSSVMNELEDIVSSLNVIYRQIIMVTGTSPDPNREYNLDMEIDGLMESFSAVCSELYSVQSSLRAIGDSDKISYAPISALVKQIESFVEKPESISSRLGSFRGNISSLSSYLYSAQQQPLDLDFIELTKGEVSPTDTNKGFFANLSFSFRQLFHSFSSNKDKERNISVWVSAGRDQMQIIKDLIDEFFSPATGITVDISLVQSGVEQAILANSGPDVVLFMGNTVPITLAYRGALYPLSSFEDFGQVVSSYCKDSSLVPYTFENEVYGLPLTETFPMLFYRTDIFEDLKIEPPQSWEELLAIIPIIQRNNMEVGVPSSYTTFLTLLFQNGGRLYREDNLKTDLSSEASYKAFLTYTQLFTDYSLPLSYDFFNRFVSGEMPLAIADYTEYGRLSYAAPEISGNWAISQIPGQGERNENVISSGMGAVILNDSSEIDSSWEFLKWFCSVDTQIEYGNRLEGLLGVAGRYPSASDYVIPYLPWLEEESEVILQTRETLCPIEQIPGSYYTQRNITSAFRNVVLENKNPRETLEQYTSIIDREIERKRREIGLEVENER